MLYQHGCVISCFLVYQVMGGDHHHHDILKVPDWKMYKVENSPELMRVQEALARKGLSDPWLR